MNKAVKLVSLSFAVLAAAAIVLVAVDILDDQKFEFSATNFRGDRELGGSDVLDFIDSKYLNCSHKKGKIYINIFKGHFPHSKDTFTTNDAYMDFRQGDQHVASSKKESEDRPNWEGERVEMCAESLTQKLRVYVLDHDVVGSNDDIGHFDIEMKDIIGQSAKKRYTLNNGAGTLELGFNFAHVKYYDDIKDDLDTGDIILMNGDTYSGQVIRAASSSEWSHVGFIYKTQQGKLRVIEASTNNAKLADCSTGIVYSGVEEVSLHDKLFSGIYTTAAIRKLNGPEAQRKKLAQAVWDNYRELRGTVYEKDLKQLFKANWALNDSPDLSSIFCSELIAYVFHAGGFIDKNHINIANNWLPKDLAIEHQGLTLKHGLSLGTETYIKDTTKYRAKLTSSCATLPGGKCECGVLDSHLITDTELKEMYENSGAERDGDHDESSHTSDSHPDGCSVMVKVHKVYNVPMHDLTTPADPYVEVSIGSEVKSTTVKMNESDPVFDEELCFKDKDHKVGDTIQFNIIDWDSLTGDDHVGLTFGVVRKFKKVCASVSHNGEICYEVHRYSS
eukprot:GFYU01004638.1.p1 GENE.GFYU01004638.1~~GFYU01004638.1.p1  ORF type:complete len:560 (+),score=211.79 GFYU01004638.1:74-1753(+)